MSYFIQSTNNGARSYKNNELTIIELDNNFIFNGDNSASANFNFSGKSISLSSIGIDSEYISINEVITKRAIVIRIPLYSGANRYFSDFVVFNTYSNFIIFSEDSISELNAFNEVNWSGSAYTKFINLRNLISNEKIENEDIYPDFNQSSIVTYNSIFNLSDKNYLFHGHFFQGIDEASGAIWRTVARFSQSTAGIDSTAYFLFGNIHIKTLIKFREI